MASFPSANQFQMPIQLIIFKIPTNQVEGLTFSYLEVLFIDIHFGHDKEGPAETPLAYLETTYQDANSHQYAQSFVINSVRTRSVVDRLDLHGIVLGIRGTALLLMVDRYFAL